MRHIVVVNNPRNWPLHIPGVEVVPARNYLTDESYSALRNVKIYNLCKSYRYQTVGYYVSLLATARGHKPIPGVLAMQDLKSQAMVRIVSDELEKMMQTALKPIKGDQFTLSIYFGKNMAKRYERLCNRLFQHFQAPLLRAEFERKEGDWLFKSISHIAGNDIPEDHRPFVIDAAQEFFRKRTPKSASRETRFDLAILVNPDEQMPPSDEKSIQRFIRAAESLDFYTELITKDDSGRINEFDALFIRETTSVNHHTYRMARRAAAEGLVVIDDPESILKCTNKVYLAELLNRNNIPAPKTVIISPDNKQSVTKSLGFPCILKQPDSSFSVGVVKVDNAEEFEHQTNELFETSDLLIAQEFIPTSFDWRVGILNQKPVYVCRYFMARKHWQIYERADGKTHSGKADTLPVEEAPKHVVDTALKAANLIGNGLYGVDLKEINGKVYVIEINDNPSIDSGYEDRILKDELYHMIMNEILKRVERKKERSLK
ncbi:ATP-grasp domain-containing protein [Rhodohalobacter sp. SW132]|uniref:RimK family protein n=1 Tax=Rhodohalobacter sp. SW132 TaxID=2293433 RepID=UPI000E22B259|nr:RimK family protein [Rhodohalobacter sp. SW132]REL33447.1 ATP-grasp domain-containing protein [Rhodohalobacter sp. SW132]